MKRRRFLGVGAALAAALPLTAIAQGETRPNAALVATMPAAPELAAEEPARSLLDAIADELDAAEAEGWTVTAIQMGWDRLGEMWAEVGQRPAPRNRVLPAMQLLGVPLRLSDDVDVSLGVWRVIGEGGRRFDWRAVHVGWAPGERTDA